MSNDAKKSGMERRDFLKSGGTIAAAGAVFLGTSSAMAGEGLLAAGSPGGHKWGFVVDLGRCTGCQACTVACKTQNSVVLGKFRAAVKEYDSGTYPRAKKMFVPWLCNHCDNPVCLVNCPAEKVKKPWGAEVAATYKRPDGVVVVDEDRCVGCGECVQDCPYGVRFLNPEKKAGGDPAENAAEKCDLCLHRLENGVVPSCVNTCPGGARAVVDLNNPGDPAVKILNSNKGIVKKLLPDKATKPQCYYLDPDGNSDEAYRKSPDRKNVLNKA